MSKSCTALSASSLEDLSAVRSCHSLSETVFLASLSLLRLICSEHNHTSFYMMKKFNDDTAFGHGLPCTQIDNSNYITRGAWLSRGNLNFLRDFEEKFAILFFAIFSLLFFSCWFFITACFSVWFNEKTAEGDLVIPNCSFEEYWRKGIRLFRFYFLSCAEGGQRTSVAGPLPIPATRGCSPSRLPRRRRVPVQL